MKIIKKVLVGLLLGVVVVSNLSAETSDVSKLSASDKGKSCIVRYFRTLKEDSSNPNWGYKAFAAYIEPGQGFNEGVCQSIGKILDANDFAYRSDYKRLAEQFTFLLMNECKDYSDPNSGAGKKTYDRFAKLIPSYDKKSYSTECRVKDATILKTHEEFIRTLLRAQFILEGQMRFASVNTCPINDYKLYMKKSLNLMYKVDEAIEDYKKSGCYRFASSHDELTYGKMVDWMEFYYSKVTDIYSKLYE